MRILAFSGSTRSGSFNQQLVSIAASAAKEAGAQTNLISLRDFPMPLYDADLEANEGMPAAAHEFRELLKGADGILIASPEYNGGLSAVLKNAIDWSTRPDPASNDDPPLVAWRGKVVGIMAGGPGRLGGIRGLSHLRTILSGIGSLVLPDQIAVPGIQDLLSEDVALSDERLHASVVALGVEVASIAASVRANPSG